MAAKSPPTASHSQTYVVTSFRAKGLIEPMDDVVKAIGEDKIFPSVLQWLKYPDGKYWGITHAWGAEILGGRGTTRRRRRRPESWKTWDDWLRDLPKLNKAPQHYGLALAGIPFFVNEDVYMWTAPTAAASSTTRATRRSRPRRCSGCSVLEEAEALPAARLGVPRLSRDAVGVGHRQDRPGPDVGPHRRLHRPVRAARQAEPGGLPGVAEDHRAHGQGPAHPVRQRALGHLHGAPGGREGGRREFLKFFFKPENYRKYCDSVPVHILSIFKADFQDSELPEPSRAQALEAVARRPGQVGGDRARPPAARLQPAGHARAVDRRRRGGAHPRRHGDGGGGAREGPKAAAKEASDKINRDIIAKAK